jgi:methionyl-tRNA formyltransferase
MDAGLILSQDRIKILPEDTVKCVYEKLSVISVPVLMRTIEQIADGSAVYREQDPDQVTQAPKLNKKHGYIKWDNPAGKIVDQIRALWPWPAAETVYVCSKTGKNWRVGIAKAHAVERPRKQGDITGALDENLHVICGEGALQVCELKPAGSRLMDFEAYVNGHQCRPGDLFISDDKAMDGLI